LRERDEAKNEPLVYSYNYYSNEDYNSVSKSSANEENENYYIYSGDTDELSDVMLAFIN